MRESFVHRLRSAAVLGAAGALLFTAVPSAAASDELGREVLGAQDGWAAANGGTTGGSAATPDHVYDVSTWDGFRAALGGQAARGDTTPRIVYVHGVLDAERRLPDGRVDCAAYQAPGFDMQQYIAAFDPEKTNWAVPAGPLED